MAYIGNVPAEKYSALTQQTFSSPTGTSFTLDQSCTNSRDIALFIDNVRQNPASYTVSGTSLTTSTISSPSTMYCLFNGRTTETVNPPDSSVGLAKLTASGTASSSNFLRGDNSWQEAGVSGITSSANTTAISISADEEVTMPLQPSFQAYLASTQSNVTGDATSYAITGAIWTEVKDTNADFTNGTFTAPVAGTYLFHGQILLGGMGSGFTLHSMWISTSNRPYRAWHESDTANTSAEQGRSFCAVADMDASDTAYLTVKVSGGAKTVDILGTSSAQTTNFSGFLLG